MSVWNLLYTYRSGLLAGLSVTLQLALCIWVIGIVFGILLGYLGSKFRVEVGLPSRVMSFFLSGIPVLVLLFWLHYPLQAVLHVVINPFYTTVFALSLINVFAVADVVRHSLNTFPMQYHLAAKVCGLSRRDTFRKIELPIISRQIIPTLLGIQVGMLQMTLFASLISVEELFRVAQRINSFVYKPVEVYSALAVFFLLICLPLNGLALWLKRKYTRDISEA